MAKKRVRRQFDAAFNRGAHDPEGGVQTRSVTRIARLLVRCGFTGAVSVSIEDAERRITNSRSRRPR
jgi:hypothetical protein